MFQRLFNKIVHISITDYEDDIVTPYATFRVAGNQESELRARRESAISSAIGQGHQTLQMHSMHPGSGHNHHHTLAHPGHRGGSGANGQSNGGPNGVCPPGDRTLDSAQYELLVTHVIRTIHRICVCACHSLIFICIVFRL